MTNLICVIFIIRYFLCLFKFCRQHVYCFFRINSIMYLIKARDIPNKSMQIANWIGHYNCNRPDHNQGTWEHVHIPSISPTFLSFNPSALCWPVARFTYGHYTQSEWWLVVTRHGWQGQCHCHPHQLVGFLLFHCTGQKVSWVRSIHRLLSKL